MRGGPRGVDGAAKATASAPFVADAAGRPALYGALLTCTSAHCRVIVDTAGLAALPGVAVVLDATSDRIGPHTTNPHGGTPDTPVFAAVGRYPGDTIGAIAATDRASLRRALARAPDYLHETPLPAVLSVDDALTGDVPAHDRYPGPIVGDVTVGATREAAQQAIAASPHCHTSTATFDPSAHGFLEKLCAAAEQDGTGWRVWSPSQCPALVRDLLAGLLDAPVIVEPAFVGGGFGGKEELTLEPAAVALSEAAGGVRVLVETTRRQMTAQYRARHGGRIEVTTGFDDEGRFLARFVDVVFEAGPYDGHSATVTGNAAATATRLYPRGVVGARGRAVATNRLPGGAFRGYGATQATFAVETHVDEIAAILGLDPIELRLRNAPVTGDLDPVTSRELTDCRAVECLEILRDSPSPDGSGVSLLVNTSAAAEEGHPDTAEVALRLEPATGAVVVETAVAEAGQGLHPMLVRVVASALGLSEDRVTVEQAVAPASAYDPGMFGSRGANVTGSAALRAAGLLREAVLARAAQVLGVDPGDVQPAAAWGGFRSGDTVVAVTALGPLRVVGRYATDDVGLAYGAQRYQVRVDAGTGAVQVVSALAVHDAGVVLHEDNARAQIAGAVGQAVGVALTETLTFRPDGSVAQTGFVNHLVPTALAVPEEVEVIFLGTTAAVGDPSTTRAKGIGEAGIMGGPAAIANAVRAATGIRPDRMPLTPERVLTALAGL